MQSGRNKLYLLLATACMAGYSWLFYNLSHLSADDSPVGVCLFRRVTTIPCPSCGSTRAVISLTEGEILQSLLINPIGLVIFMIMVILPPWIIFDLIANKQTLFNFYKKSESYLRKPSIAIVLVVLVLLNWIWNIMKGV